MGVRLKMPKGFIVEHRRTHKPAVPPPWKAPKTVVGSMEKTAAAPRRERTVHNIESKNLTKELKRRASTPWQTKA